MNRHCINSPNIFCYICGKYSTHEQRLPINKFVRQCYHAYFGCQLGDQDKSWAPHSVCKSCVEMLRQWTLGVKKSLPFGVPMVWREPTNHLTDCYFCMVHVKGFNNKNKHQIQYPNPPSVSLPAPHSDDVPIPHPPTSLSECDTITESSSTEKSDNDEDFRGVHEHSPKLFEQEGLDDLVRDLNLSKQAAELLGSRLRERNLLAPDTTFYWYRHREREFIEFFILTDSLVYCHNVKGLVAQMGCTYDSSEWRLFIDSSKRSLKAVLLHNGNQLASLPLAHSISMKETYDNMRILLSALNYNEHRWLICGDLKVIAILLGLQGGYTKYPCFLCLWDSRADDCHFKQKVWPQRTDCNPGQHNQQSMPLVERSKILLPPLHIKLGLMKLFVKALNKNGSTFQYLREKYPKISEAKLHEGIFIGPQIRELLMDSSFMTRMTAMEKAAWANFKDVVERFLGNRRDENYVQCVTRLISSYKKLGCRMSVKLHFLHSHLNYFPENLGSYSEEQGERFHQDISEMERRYQGLWNVNMMADYCWCLKRHKLDDHKKQSRKRSFLG
jgi:hypothetical protein